MTSALALQSQHHKRCSRERTCPLQRYISAFPRCTVTDSSCIAQRTNAPLGMRPLSAAMSPRHLSRTFHALGKYLSAPETSTLLTPYHPCSVCGVKVEAWQHFGMACVISLPLHEVLPPKQPVPAVQQLRWQVLRCCAAFVLLRVPFVEGAPTHGGATTSSPL